MAATQNYSLPLPQLGEPADIRVLDQGTEMIDGIMHGNRTMIAPGWVSTETYNTGSRVVYLGEYYKCKEDNVTGAWDATKWDKTTVGEDIEGLGTGGASALADLDDVEITNPSTGQALLFDDDVWKNQDLPDVSVTKEASGNPLTFSDGADAPLVECKTTISAKQDLHGYSKPWVGGGGKNKLPQTSSGTQTINGITFTPNDDGSVKVTGTATGTANYSYITNNASSPLKAGNWRAYASGLSNVRFVIGGTQSSITGVTLLEDGYTDFTLDNDYDTLGYCTIQVASGNTVNTTVYLMITSQNDTSTFEPYSNLCPISGMDEVNVGVGGKNLLNNADAEIGTAWNGGSNSARARLVVKKEPYTPYVISMNGTNNMDAIYVKRYSSVPASDAGTQITSFPVTIPATDDNTFLIFAFSKTAISQTDVENLKLQVEKGSTATTYEPYKGTTTTITLGSTRYGGELDAVRGVFRGTHGYADLGDLLWTYDSTYNYFQARLTGLKKYNNGDTPNMACEAYQVINARYGSAMSGVSTGVICPRAEQDWIQIKDTNYTDPTLFKTSVTGYKLVYELATPTTDTLSPTSIRSLLGYNTMWTDGDTLEVEYITEGYQALVDLIQSGTGHTYSTSEQVVGKWIDGKTLYEQTIIFPNVISLTANAFTDVYDLSTIGVESLVEFTPYTDNVAPLRPFGYFIPDITSANMLRLNIPNTGWYIGGMTIRYTKSTATRSLSAPVTSQKAQIEPLTDKTEEVPTDTEKTAEKPETEEENDER